MVGNEKGTKYHDYTIEQSFFLLEIVGPTSKKKRANGFWLKIQKEFNKKFNLNLSVHAIRKRHEYIKSINPKSIAFNCRKNRAVLRTKNSTSNPELQTVIEQSIKDNPFLPDGQRANLISSYTQFSPSRVTVHRIIKKLHYKYYKRRKLNYLTQRKADIRLAYCESFTLEMWQNNKNFIYWTDEKSFEMDKHYTNRQNDRCLGKTHSDVPREWLAEGASKQNYKRLIHSCF